MVQKRGRNIFGGCPPIYLNGNKTGEYSVGQTVTIPVHIIGFMGVEGILETSGGSTGGWGGTTSVGYHISYADNNCTITIDSITPVKDIDDIKWYILDEEEIFQAGGCILVANNNSTISNSICIYTYDSNMDGKLAGGDTLKIWDTGDKTIQSGWKLRLKYVPTGEIICQIIL